MPPLKLEQFGGMLPAWGDRLLPAGQASDALNTYLFSGELTGWRKPKRLTSPVLDSTAIRSVFRVPVITQAAAAIWVDFTGLPSEGDEVSIAEDTYTFKAVVVEPNEVLIGATPSACRDNLFAAATFDEGLGTNNGTLYGMGTAHNPVISKITGVNSTLTLGNGNPGIHFVAPDVGEAFNTTSVSNVGPVAFRSDATGDEATTHFVGGVNPSFDNTITGPGKWLQFADANTDVMRSQVVDDKFNRYYFASPGLPPKYNTYDRIQDDLPAWMLGLNPPACAPVVTVTGGGNAAIIGHKTLISSTTFGFASNSVYLLPVTPDAALSMEDISFMPAETQATAKFAGVLYDDFAGAPNQLIAYTNVIQGATSGTQVTLPFTNPPGLLSGVKYWIGVMSDTTMNIYRETATPADGVTFNQPFVNGPPTFAPAPAATAIPDLNMWADCTTGSILAARSYVYTWVSEYGEESPPSPYTLVNGWSNGTWTIGLWQPPPDDMGVVRNIKKIRIYRTVTSTQGIASFLYVAEVLVGTAEYVDISDDAIVSNNNQLASATWFPPPEGLQSIKAMPNGIAVGFRGNEIWFSEPYQPHAWPPNYVLTTDFPIVGIGISGQSVIAATSGCPYIATGVTPSNMTLQKTTIPEPCVARGSIVGGDTGVYYSSPNGLILVSSSGAVTNTTDSWITREKWRQLTPQTSNIRAVLLASCYFCFDTTPWQDLDDLPDAPAGLRGFVIELSTNDSQSFTIWPQPGGHRVGFNRLASPIRGDQPALVQVPIQQVQLDPWTGICLLIANNGVYYYDFSDLLPEIVVYTWRSKKHQQGSKRNFEVMKVYFDDAPPLPDGQPLAAERKEDATSDASWETLPDDRYGFIRVFADGQLVTTREIRVSGEVLRILSGFKADTWQWEITARVQISNFQVATSVKELSQV